MKVAIVFTAVVLLVCSNETETPTRETCLKCKTPDSGELCGPRTIQRCMNQGNYGSNTKLQFGGGNGRK
ncbi:hypothetical protein PRIPAC_93822 [Pristionchus pacificus]|uniref:Uncharacterized protein n=1 Tax=Pristionchus pacificus TaxID=54126 RepID=A0A2A6BQY7_PRIPA|nr:hypothetical protein PRIPAC_93822 [Pristionchus pacificus]|eukprot:PDM68246.1 hypothetical protein PRIPAC_46290 [Pristionchus pacificus]